MNLSQTVYRPAFFLTLLVCGVVFTACNKDTTTEPTVIFSAQGSDQIASPIPTSPGAMIIPSDNPMTSQKIQLGRFLFFDPNLGVPFTKNGKTTGISCASCHSPNHAFSDTSRFSSGIQDFKGSRQAPSLINTGYNTYYTWDGKFYTFEEQAVSPIFSPLEMGNNYNPSPDKFSDYWNNPGSNDTLVLFKRLNATHPAEYYTMLMKAYGDPMISLDRIVKALACFERTLVSSGSPFDDYNKSLHNEGGNGSAISESAKRGFRLFTDSAKTNCVSCHNGFSFTNGTFANNGLAAVGKEKGREMVTYNPAHQYQFKIPTLRNLSMTAPYMHDGRFTTLEQVMDHYLKGGSEVENKDPRIHRLNLTPEEVKDIIAFLTSLNDKHYSAGNSAMAIPTDPNLLQ